LSAKPLKQILGGRNLYLIGMMGSGKTVTGPPLSKQLGYRFVDIDAVVEKVTKKSISQIFKEDGEESFRNIETQVLKEIGQHYSLVVSTGGGIVLRSENWGILHQGIVIWLDPGREKLLARLQSGLSNRPLLNTSNHVDVFDSIFQERKPLYKESDLQVFIEDESPEEVALMIIQNLPSILKNPEAKDG
tara:strand:+ start:274 stop:840 length:567 start_codon:yes stop_codon:yes gene_type:complete